MNKHLTGVVVAVLAAVVLAVPAAPAFADHRPGNVVLFGGTISQTGVRAVRAGRVYNGRKLYVDELNARGGLLGHRVELKIYDDKSDKRPAIELYEKLITKDKVDLVLGPYGSHIGGPVANVMERYKQPFIAHASRLSIWQRGRKFVFSGPGVFTPDRAKASLHVAKMIGVKRIAIISQPGVTNLQVLVGAQKWAKKLGLKVVFSERFESEFYGKQQQTEFRALLQRIEASGAEAIISNAGMPESVSQLRQLRELNINVKMVAMLRDAETPEFAEELGSTAEYVVGHSTWEPKPVLGYPGIKEFIENYEKRYGEKPTFHAASGYAGMQITEAAVKEAGSFDPEKVRDALASITVQTVRGTYKANEQGRSPMEGVAFQIQNGKRLIVWPAHQAEAKVLPMPKWEDRIKK